MCGIAGYLRLRPEKSAPISADVAGEMLTAIRRRGPDAAGEWRSADHLCWLGHRRLAIIDLSTGDQPMTSEDSQITLVYNGEIYNYLEIRDELAAKGYRFHTSSDTEVLLRTYEAYGDDCLKQTSCGPDTLRNPEPDFYILGAKSYGRNSHFLLRIGFEQVREVFTLIAGKADLNLYAKG